MRTSGAVQNGNKLTNWPQLGRMGKNKLFNFLQGSREREYIPVAEAWMVRPVRKIASFDEKTAIFPRSAVGTDKLSHFTLAWSELPFVVVFSPGIFVSASIHSESNRAEENAKQRVHSDCN